MSFYRLYRPQIIDEIDNSLVRERLTELLTKDKSKLPHAFLLTGPRGGGKTTAARIIAKLFNCTHTKKSGPCGTCDQCQSIALGKNLDVLELDAASNRGIDEIRALRDAIHLTPTSALFKVYIIDEVHMLTSEAFNALLKTLEEPPAHAVFVLATTDPQKVPSTIKSRCTHLSFHKATSDELMAALGRIVKKEKIPIEKSALLRIAGSVDGSFRDAVKLLEQVSFHKGAITDKVISQYTGFTDDAMADGFLALVKVKDVKASLQFIEKLVSGGSNMQSFLTVLLSRLEQELLETRSQDVQLLIRSFTQAYGLMKISPIPQLPLELAVVEFCGEPRSVVEETVPASQKRESPEEPGQELGLLTLEKLTDHWADVIAELKPYNHSVAGVLRSARPKSVGHGIVGIEAFYQFHKDKLSESKTKDILSTVLKKLFGESVKIEVVLGKK